MGVGNPPPGWPLAIPWTGFKGVGMSGLTNIQLTQIIVGMYKAAGYDPETYVQDEQEEGINTQENQDDDDLEADKEGLENVELGAFEVNNNEEQDGTDRQDQDVKVKEYQEVGNRGAENIDRQITRMEASDVDQSDLHTEEELRPERQKDQNLADRYLMAGEQGQGEDIVIELPNVMNNDLYPSNPEPNVLSFDFY